MSDGAGDDATRAWRAMRALVLDNDRRGAVAEELGLSFAKAKALRRLAAGDATLRELAVALGADPPYVTLIVDDLERRVLVRREPHPQDRRAKLVRLTPEGRRAAERADEILDAPPSALSELGGRELTTLARLLEAVVAAAQQRAATVSQTTTAPKRS